MPTKALHPEPVFTLDAISPGTGEEAGPRLSMPERRSGPKFALLAVLALVFGALAIYFYWPRSVPLPQQVAPTPSASNPAPQAKLEPALQHPVEKIPAAATTESGRPQVPIPGLDDSDVIARDAIETILNGDAFFHLLVPDGIIRHIVATVDNLPRKKIAPRILAIKPVHGPLATASTARGMSIAGDNAGRYTAYVKAAESIDTERLVGFYIRLYPLFQQAYVELGYPGGYFNDRLIGVIDHLLAAPEPKHPVYLSQPNVMFEFADPDLEELSAGQKILVRIGVDSELRLKAKLRDIRKTLAAPAANR